MPKYQNKREKRRMNEAPRVTWRQYTQGSGRLWVLAKQLWKQWERLNKTIRIAGRFVIFEWVAPQQHNKRFSHYSWSPSSKIHKHPAGVPKFADDTPRGQSFLFVSVLKLQYASFVVKQTIGELAAWQCKSIEKSKSTHQNCAEQSKEDEKGNDTHFRRWVSIQLSDRPTAMLLRTIIRVHFMDLRIAFVFIGRFLNDDDKLAKLIVDRFCNDFRSSNNSIIFHDLRRSSRISRISWRTLSFVFHSWWRSEAAPSSSGRP
jgi:hypothetical protein